MITAFKNNWRVYLIEAWALGMFMCAACIFVILFEHPYFKIPILIPSPLLRRIFIAFAMACTAVLLIYSKWGRQSGAHMNPAITLANYQLDRISLPNAIWYMIAQFAGAAFFVYLFKWFAFGFISHPSVLYIVTRPGTDGVRFAFLAEFILAFIMLTVVLIVNNSRLAKYTGYFAGALVFLFIAFEAPISGMSINPARSFASAFAGNIWDSFLVYIIAPVAGMQLAALIYRRIYLFIMGECKSMKLFMSGLPQNNAVYRVLCWYHHQGKGKLTKYNQSYKNGTYIGNGWNREFRQSSRQ